MPEKILTATVPHFNRIHDWRGAWMMEYASVMALRELVLNTNFAEHMQAPAMAYGDEEDSIIEYVPSKAGKNIAMIRLTGTMMKSRSSYGGTSTVDVRRSLRNAANDPNVSGILLAIDSPGGTSAGTYELGQDVKRAADTKPTWAFIDDLCASAAYWAASQCSQIYAANPTSQVGSIGTYWTLYDHSAKYEKDGVKVHHFTTGPLKGAGVPGAPITDQQAANFDGQVQQMQTYFDEAVRTGRNMSVKELQQVRTGGMFFARDAIGLKLIDGIKSLEATIKALASAK